MYDLVADAILRNDGTISAAWWGLWLWLWLWIRVWLRIRQRRWILGQTGVRWWPWRPLLLVAALLRYPLGYTGSGKPSGR